MTHKTIYGLNDCDVEIYIDATNPGIAPDGTTSTWADDGSSIFAIGTGWKYGTKKEATLVNGPTENGEPVGTRVGNVTRDWSFDSVYTNDTYGGNTKKLSQFADGDVGMFAMRIAVGTADETILEYCTCTSAEVTGGSDGLTISMSGIHEVMSQS